MAASIPGFAHLLDNNAKFAQNYSAPPSMAQTRKAIFSNPDAAGGTLILTCLDPRVVPERFLGPDVRIAVLRNAGGQATDEVITDIVALRTLAKLSHVVVIQHTDCGKTHVTKEEVVKDVTKRTPGAKGWAEKTDFGFFTGEGLEENLRESVERLRGAEAMEGVRVYGMVYDVQTGLVREVDV